MVDFRLRSALRVSGALSGRSYDLVVIDRGELRVVHALRLKGFATVDVVAAAAEVAPDDAEVVLVALADVGHARHRDGALAGWMLTPTGRARGEQLLAADLDAAGRRADLDAAYRRFLVHNKPFLALCADWQTRLVDGERVRNDHADLAYDRGVLDRLGAADAAIQPVCAELADIRPRFASYGQRFEHALAQVRGGDTDWFTKPVIDSYHTVWFELHEDLLASLGIERAKEAHA